LQGRNLAARNPSVDDSCKSRDRIFIETQHGLARGALKDADFAEGGDLRGIFSRSQIEKVREHARSSSALSIAKAQMQQMISHERR